MITSRAITIIVSTLTAAGIFVYSVAKGDDVNTGDKQEQAVTKEQHDEKKNCDKRDSLLNSINRHSDQIERQQNEIQKRLKQLEGSMSQGL